MSKAAIGPVALASRGLLFLLLGGWFALGGLACGSGARDEQARASSDLLAGPLPPATGAPDAGAPASPPAAVSTLYIVAAADCDATQVSNSQLVVPATAVVRNANTPAVTKPIGAVAAGDFLVSDIGTSHRFLRQAAAPAATAAGLVTVSTSQALLTDVIGGGGTAHVTLANVGAPTGGLKPNAAIGLGSYTVTLPTAQASFSPFTVAVRSGSHLTVSPTVDLDFAFNLVPPGLSSFTAKLSTGLDGWIGLALSAGGSGTASTQIPIFSAPTDFAFAIGPVPVAGVATLSFSFNCSATAAASETLNTGVFIGGSVSAGISYDGNWHALAEMPTLRADPATAMVSSATLSGQCWLQPELNILFYDAAGPDVWVEIGLGASATLESPPNHLDLETHWFTDGFAKAEVKFWLIDVESPTLELGVLNHSGTIWSQRVTLNPNDPCHDAADGYYCGNDPAGGFAGGAATATRYQCTAHRTAGTSSCTYGCIHGDVSQDYCHGAPPPPSNYCSSAADGVYCGYSTMDGFPGTGAHNTLYFCHGHVQTQTQACASGCSINSSGADYCSNVCSGAADGVYCGYSTVSGFSGKGLANDLYSCHGHVVTQVAPCAYGCTIQPVGADTCNGAPVCGGTLCGSRCCAAGDWCGASGQCCSGCTAGCPC